jgi:hypothetical protein
MFDISAIPWELGQTANFGLATVDPTFAANLEGMEYVIRDIACNYPAELTGLPRRVRLVRNKTGIALLPGRLVTLDPANNYKYVLGYPIADAEQCYPVDEFLPSTGVADGDLFYVTTGGPALLMQAGTPVNIAAAGQQVTAALAASRTTTTGGRVKLQDVSGTGTALRDNLYNAFTALVANNVANAQFLAMVPWTERY